MLPEWTREEIIDAAGQERVHQLRGSSSSGLGLRRALRRGQQNVGPSLLHTSKRISQAELNLAIAGICAGHAAERSSPQSTAGIGELRRVESVEKLGSELQRMPIAVGHLELLSRRQVEGV